MPRVRGRVGALFSVVVCALAASGCATFTTFVPSEVVWMQKHQMDAKAPLCPKPIAHDVRWLRLRAAEKGGSKVVDDETRKLVDDDEELWAMPAKAVWTEQIFEQRQPLLAKWARESQHPVLAAWVRRFETGSARPPLAGSVTIDAPVARQAELLFEGKFGAWESSAKTIADQHQRAWDAQGRIDSGAEQMGDREAINGLGLGTNLAMTTGYSMLSLLATLKKDQNDREVLAAQTSILHTLNKTGVLSKAVPPDRLLYLYFASRGEFDQEARIITDSIEALAFVTQPTTTLAASRSTAMLTTINDETPPPGMVTIDATFDMTAYVTADAVYELCVAAELDATEDAAPEEG